MIASFSILGREVWYSKNNAPIKGIVWGIYYGDDYTLTTNFTTIKMRNGDKIRDELVFESKEECVSYIIEVISAE